MSTDTSTYHGGKVTKFDTSYFMPSFLLNWGQEAYEWLFDVKKKLREHLIAFTANPYKDIQAKVRIGNELCEQEKAYRELRKKRVKSALQGIVQRDIDDDHIPTIALVCSGGGYRAAISTLGWLVGAHKNGLLDVSTYATGISGSCWMIGSWISSGLSIEQCRESMVDKMARGLAQVSSHGALLIADSLLVKYASDQPITIVDFYGSLLSHVLFRDLKDGRHRVHLSEQADRIKTGDSIFPIYSAISSDQATMSSWYEFTPFEVGAHWLNAYIPAWAYAREFYDGVSIDYDPEQSLGYLFGMFGSAFSASFNRIYHEFKENISFGATKYIIEKILNKVGNKSISTAKVHNFTYGMPDSPIKDKNKLRLVDAGISLNLGYQPVSGQRKERKADVMIMLEASADVAQANSLRNVEQYARQYNLPFPTIDYSVINKKAATVFIDDNNLDAPVIVYMPLTSDQELWNARKSEAEFVEFQRYLEGFDPIDCIENSYCSTFDFSYQEAELRQLSALTEFNMRASSDLIFDAIQKAIERKNSSAIK